jgi:hypothetical protein
VLSLEAFVFGGPIRLGSLCASDISIVPNSLLRQRSATSSNEFGATARAFAIVAPDLASSSFSELAGGQMGRAFTAIGIVALIGAVAWWQTFYGEVQRLLASFCREIRRFGFDTG